MVVRVVRHAMFWVTVNGRVVEVRRIEGGNPSAVWGKRLIPLWALELLRLPVNK